MLNELKETEIYSVMVSSSPKIPGSLGTPDQLLGLKRLSEVEGK